MLSRAYHLKDGKILKIDGVEACQSERARHVWMSAESHTLYTSTHKQKLQSKAKFCDLL
jgi:hypothetical protein